MHKLILWIFENLNNIGQTLSLICSFFVIATLLCWLEILVNAQWNWLNFIKPIVEIVTGFTESIIPFSITAFGTVFDGKYITAIIILLFLTFIFRVLIEALMNLKESYNDMHFAHKKHVERTFNKNLINKVVSKETKVSKYMILINTRLQKKFTHKECHFDLHEQNDLMNKFIMQKTNTNFEIMDNGFLYQFEDFNNIDNILDVLFKMKKSSSPLEYSICIQVGSEKNQLKKLADLQYFGKIIFCADTLLRYKCNKSHRYGTQNVGVFQLNDINETTETIEVHEFNEIS